MDGWISSVASMSNMSLSNYQVLPKVRQPDDGMGVKVKWSLRAEISSHKMDQSPELSGRKRKREVSTGPFLNET